MPDEGSLLSTLYSESEKKFLLQYLRRERPGSDYGDIIARLNKGEPIDYILGYTYFYGLKIYVDSSTLIPRPETEELVALIVEENKHRSHLKIVDIGTGSGCIAVALSQHLHTSYISAWDISPAAIEKAKENADAYSVNIDFQCRDICSETLLEVETLFDIIVSNPPYIPEYELSSLSPSVLDYEPRTALIAEKDPLIFYRKILDFARTHLSAEGRVYFETSQVIQLESYPGFQIEKIKDMSGNWRFLKCVKLSV